jgi:hypothetical protein
MYKKLGSQKFEFKVQDYTHPLPVVKLSTSSPYLPAALHTLCQHTHNSQVVAILAAGQELPFTVQPAKLDLPELQGEPEDISRAKCRIAAQQLGGAVMVEDTSLCFNALQGLPGVCFVVCFVCVWGGGGGDSQQVWLSVYHHGASKAMFGG